MAPSAVFETRRLIGRRWTPADFEAVYAIYSDPEAMRWVGEGKPITRESCLQWFDVTAANYRTRGYGMLALEDKVSGEVVGCCGLTHPGGQADPEIKYTFLRRLWGQGLASEIVPALLAYGAQQHGLIRVIATVDPENVASQKTLTRAGAELIERRREDDGTTTLVYRWSAAG